MRPLLWLFGALTAASTAYYAGVVVAGARHRAQATRRESEPADRPPVSILKPLRGEDPQLADNLRSHSRQDYPELEVVCGVADPNDPAIAAVRDLQNDGSRPPVRLFDCGPPGEGNAKAAILARLEAEARHSLILVSDADVRLSAGDLRRLVDELTPATGLVSALYRARPGGSAASRLDAAWISGDFAGQALVGAHLARMSFALGAAMLFRKEDLNRIGGFAAIGPYLADDHELGRRLSELGRPVRLSSVVVETVLGAPTWGQVWRRHLRWSRTIRASRPGGHAGFGVTFGTLWGLGLLAAGGPAWPLACALAGRAAASASTARLLGVEPVSTALTAPLAELWAAAVWAWSFTSREVVWRGRRLRLDRSGRIHQSPG